MTTAIPFAHPPATLLPRRLQAANLDPAVALAPRDAEAPRPPDALTVCRAAREEADGASAEQETPAKCPAACPAAEPLERLEPLAEARADVEGVVEVELGGGPDSDLSSKTVKELRDVAAQRGVSLAGATNKRSILKRLQES